jgi:uncharacterized protein (TIGR02391 family)
MNTSGINKLQKTLKKNINKTHQQESAMKERPTLSKAELKKMFLKVLYETLYGSMDEYSSNIDYIVSSLMNLHYEIELTDKEIELTYVAIQELKNQGILVKDSYQSDDSYQVLTQKGKEIVEKMQDPDAYALRLEEVLKNQDLLNVCLDVFNEGDYETAIFKAYRFVEEKVREKAQLEARDIGIDLMNKAFKPSNGKLIVTTCAVPAEQEGVQSLFRGAISFFKNPLSHRTVDYNDRQVARQVIAFAELLLDILSKTELRH